MTYSPRGRWMALGAVVLLTAAWAWYGVVIRPSRDIIPWVGSVFVLAAFALSFRAYFYLDEIQQKERMRAWYYGAPLGVASVGILTLYLGNNPGFLDTLVDILPHHQPHKPFHYFVAGVMFTMLPQMVGNYIARISMALIKRDT